jgi:arylsulfatase A-like enzyme
VIDYDSGKPVVHSGLSPRIAPFPLREDLFYDCTLAQQMVDIIKEHSGKNDDRPLALLGMFWLPHPPMWAPHKWAGVIDPQEVRLPASIGRWYMGMAARQLANVPGQLGAHVGMEQWKHAWAMYIGMTGLLDQCVGSVLATLDKRAMLDDSLVAFTADHGEMLGSHKLYQKMCLYEETVRVPLILKMPGQTQSRRIADLTDHLDLTATLLDEAGADPLPHSPGRSLSQAATGATPQDKMSDMVFASYDGNAGRGFQQRMVRSRSHKLIHVIDDHAELYALVDDPRETNNLVGHPDTAAVDRQLRDALNKWMDEQNDPLARC